MVRKLRRRTWPQDGKQIQGNLSLSSEAAMGYLSCVLMLVAARECSRSSKSSRRSRVPLASGEGSLSREYSYGRLRSYARRGAPTEEFDRGVRSDIQPRAERGRARADCVRGRIRSLGLTCAADAISTSRTWLGYAQALFTQSTEQSAMSRGR